MKKTDWNNLEADRKKEGKTIREYCHEQGIPEWRYYQRRSRGSRMEKRSLLPAVVVDPEKQIEVICGNIHIRLPLDTSRVYLEELFSALRVVQ